MAAVGLAVAQPPLGDARVVFQTPVLAVEALALGSWRNETRNEHRSGSSDCLIDELTRRGQVEADAGIAGLGELVAVERPARVHRGEHVLSAILGDRFTMRRALVLFNQSTLQRDTSTELTARWQTGAVP